MNQFDALSNEAKLMMMAKTWGIDETTETVMSCSAFNCQHCLFKEHGNCKIARVEWLQSEVKYQIPVDTPIDAKVLVSDRGYTWLPRHFAGRFDNNGKALIFESGRSSWTSNKVTTWNHVKLADEQEDLV